MAMRFSWLLLGFALGPGCSRHSRATAVVATPVPTPTVASAAPSQSTRPAPPVVAAQPEAGAPARFAKLGGYTFHTLDGYDFTTTDLDCSAMIFVWSTRCKSCDSLRALAAEMYRQHPEAMFIAISRDDESKWRAHLGCCTPFTEVRDAKTSFVRDTGAADGTVFLVAPDLSIRWRGEWRSSDADDVERRFLALPGVKP